MAKKKDFSTFDVASGISSFISDETKEQLSEHSTMDNAQDLTVAGLEEISHDVENPRGSTNAGISTRNVTPRRGRPRQYTNAAGESVTRSERITLYLTPEQTRMVDYIARIKGVSKSKLLTDIISNEMEKPEYKKAYDAMTSLQAQL